MSGAMSTDSGPPRNPVTDPDTTSESQRLIRASEASLYHEHNRIFGDIVDKALSASRGALEAGLTGGRLGTSSREFSSNWGAKVFRIVPKDTPGLSVENIEYLEARDSAHILQQKLSGPGALGRLTNMLFKGRKKLRTEEGVTEILDTTLVMTVASISSP